MKSTPVKLSERMRALNWRESALFGHSFIRGEWCVGVWYDGWTLGKATAMQGNYAIIANGVTVADLEAAMRAAEIPMEDR